MAGWAYQKAGQGSEGIHFYSVSCDAQESSSDVRPTGRANFWESFLVMRLGRERDKDGSCGLCSVEPQGSVSVRRGVLVGEWGYWGKCVGNALLHSFLSGGRSLSLNCFIKTSYFSHCCD